VNASAPKRSKMGARYACSVRMARSWTRKELIMTRLENFYKEQVIAKLTEQFGYQNVMQVPRITKITLNMGVGEAAGNKKVLENAVADMAKIAAQKPITTKARVSVASFKIRDGWPIGCKVTLRRAQMWEFLDRLINISLPRVRDFRGVSAKAFDGRGNYNFGIREQIIFPEIDFDQVDALRGMDISITTTANTDDEAKALLTAFSFPFRN
jgi:large subunit ribosomal protein L5